MAHPTERFLNLLHAAAKECVEIMEGRGKTGRVTGHNILSNTFEKRKQDYLLRCDVSWAIAPSHVNKLQLAVYLLVIYTKKIRMI